MRGTRSNILSGLSSALGALLNDYIILNKIKSNKEEKYLFRQEFIKHFLKRATHSK